MNSSVKPRHPLPLHNFGQENMHTLHNGTCSDILQCLVGHVAVGSFRFPKKVEGSKRKIRLSAWWDIGIYCQTAEKNRGRGVAEKNQTNTGRQPPRERTGKQSRANPTGSTPPSLPPPPSLSRRSQINQYTLPSHQMAPLLSPPLLADTGTKFHAASAPVSCSGSPQRYAIAGLAGAGRRDRNCRRRTRGRTSLRVKAVAAESRSSEGGIAEDYYAVLGVVGASS